MNGTELKALEQELGFNLDPKQQGVIQDLYDVPPSLLQVARKLHSTILRYQLLRYYTSSSLWRWLPEFIDDVIEHEVESQNWVRGGFLIPLYSVDTLVTLNVDQILSVLEPKENELWLQVNPERQAWECQEYIMGSPAVLRPNLRYDWQEPEHVRRVMASGANRMEKIGDIVVATRRWLASCIAGRTLALGGIERFTDPILMFKTVFPSIEHPSEDAIIAADAVFHEINTMGHSNIDVPGFRGPVDWYL